MKYEIEVIMEWSETLSRGRSVCW